MMGMRYTRFVHSRILLRLQKADTFDIILFKTKRLASKVTRAVTDSEFDHAGVIMKFQNLLNTV